jgi:hypothetical protein
MEGTSSSCFWQGSLKEKSSAPGERETKTFVSLGRGTSRCGCKRGIKQSVAKEFNAADPGGKLPKTKHIKKK